MKELRISKYSKAWFIKRNDRLTTFTIILLWITPVLLGVSVAFIEINNIKLSIVFGLITMLDIIMWFHMADSINENYDDYIYRLISKQKRKQDRKWRKWLI